MVTSTRTVPTEFVEIRDSGVIVALERMLCFTIPETTGTMSGRQFEGLADRFSQGDSKFLISVANWLQDFLAASSFNDVEPIILRDVNGFLGAIRHWNKEYVSAREAYIRAAWIEQRAMVTQPAAVLRRPGTLVRQTSLSFATGEAVRRQSAMEL